MDYKTKKVEKFSERMHEALKGTKPLFEKRDSIKKKIVNHRNQAIGWRDAAEEAEDQLVTLKNDLMVTLGDGGDPTEVNEKIVTLTQQVSNYREWATQIEDEFLPPLIAALEEINGNITNAAQAQICNLRETVTVEVDNRLADVADDLNAWLEAVDKTRSDLEIKGEIGPKLYLKKYLPIEHSMIGRVVV